MPIDAAIYGQFAPRQKSVQDFQNEYDARQLQQQNLGLNKLQLLSGQQKLDEYQRGVRDQDTVRNALMQLGPQATDDARVNALRATGLPSGFTQADALQKTLIERDKGQSEARAKQAEVLGKVIGAQGDLAKRVMANPTPEFAAAALANMKTISAALGVPIDFSADEQALTTFTTPQQIQRWAQGHALKAEELLPKFQMVNSGKVQTPVDMNPATNPAGPAPIAMTTTPGEDLSAQTSRANNRDTQAGENYRQGRSLKQSEQLANQAVTYQTDGNGNIVALPSKVAPGQMVRAQGVAAPGAGLSPLQGKSDLTDSQAKALLFGTRMQEADKILNTLAAEGTDRPSIMKQGADRVPVLGGVLGMAANAVASPEQQQVEQAQRDFVNAMLRRESGAVISPTEFDSAKQQYFPQVGDSTAVKAQKAKNRELATNGMLAEVPQNKRKIPGQATAAPTAPTAGGFTYVGKVK